MRLLAYIGTDRMPPDEQRQTVRAWAKAEGHKVTTWADGSEASPSDAVALALSSQVGIVVASLPCLSAEVATQEAVRHALHAAGLPLRSVSADDERILSNDTTPARRLARTTLERYADLARRLAGARVTEGQQRKAETGGYIGGAPPYGYRAEGGELVEVKAEQAALRRIDKMRRDGASLRSIASALDAQGVPPRRGNAWSAEAVRRIIVRLESDKGGPTDT